MEECLYALIEDNPEAFDARFNELTEKLNAERKATRHLDNDSQLEIELRGKWNEMMEVYAWQKSMRTDGV